MLDLLENYSCLVSENQRRGSNSPEMKMTYQVNPAIAFNWELAIARRGTVNFDKIAIESIFEVLGTKFNEFKTQKLKSYKFPFKSEPKEKTIKEKTLFDE